MRLDIGYLLLSKEVLKRLEGNPGFASDFGQALRKHLKSYAVKKDSLIPSVLNGGVQLKTYFNDFIVITEKDKNIMPRTTVVLWEEGSI